MIVYPGWQVAPISHGPHPQIPFAPDPRISTLRPGWLADDQEWRDQLQAMTREEAQWFDGQWTLAGGRPASVDMSWITFERAPQIAPALWVLFGIVAVGLGAAFVGWWWMS